METVRSADGTELAYERDGEGPALVVVNGALSDRRGGAAVAGLLAAHFTVFRYDRRGRGNSGDAPTYAVEREAEDLAAIPGATGKALAGQEHGVDPAVLVPELVAFFS